MLTRRRVLKLLGAIASTSSMRGAVAVARKELPPWQPGELELHHIDTGRGNATFILAPDATTILIDCGEVFDGGDALAPARPNKNKRVGEWVARYALRRAKQASRDSLDYMIATHIHPDHVGDVPKGAEKNADGYVPTGLSQVDGLMPAELVIDRGFGDYGLLPPMDAPFAQNYQAWLAARVKQEKRVEALVVGSVQQIHHQSMLPQGSPSFSILGVAANGKVWTGEEEQSRSLFPDLKKLSHEEWPTENECSIALRLDYGHFSYFTGGDLSASTNDGHDPWMDVESPIAKACGRVEVALADHHGYADACGAGFVKSLDASVYVLSSWHATHPAQESLERLLGERPGEQARAVYATEMLPANKVLNSRWVKLMKSTQGHVVVRVAADAKSYKVYVVDSAVEEGAVTLESGPFACRV